MTQDEYKKLIYGNIITFVSVGRAEDEVFE
jgi:hypothetical protein